MVSPLSFRASWIGIGSDRTVWMVMWVGSRSLVVTVVFFLLLLLSGWLLLLWGAHTPGPLNSSEPRSSLPLISLALES